MLGLVNRNLRLYFGNRSGVLFSLIGALIAFVLYLVFLKHNMLQSWQGVPHQTTLLDNWLIGGTLATTAITTTGHAVSLVVTDRDQGRLVDLVLTDVRPVTIQVAYAITGIIVGTVMQLIMFIGLTGYFHITDNLPIAWELLPKLIAIAGLNAVIWTFFNLLVDTFIRKMATLSTVQSLIGTAAGFFVGVYMPIGLLPKAAQHLMEWTPAPYSASLYRQLLLAQPLQDAFQHTAGQTTFRKLMGIGIDLNGLTSWSLDALILGCCALGFAIIVGLAAQRSQLLALKRH